MPLPLLLRNHRFAGWAIRIDMAPAWWWLAAQLTTLASVWLLVTQQWPALAVLAMLAALSWPLRTRLRAAPRLGWLVLAQAATVCIPVAHQLPTGSAPVLLAATTALVAGLLAFLPGRTQVWGSHPLLVNSFMNRVLHKTAYGVSLLLCATWAAVGAAGRA